MKIEEITDYQKWTSFFNESGSPTFLQAWEWGELQKKNGHNVIRLGVFDSQKIIGIAQVIHMKARRGNFLFLPHGPLGDEKKILKVLVEHLRALGKEYKCSHIRISPILINSEVNVQTFRKLGFKNAATHMHAEHIWQLGIDMDEDKLLSEMRKTTRNLIRRAIKDDVKIELTTDRKALKNFMKTYAVTAKRENFTPFSKSFIDNEFAAFNERGHAVILNGRVGSSQKCLSSAIVLFTKSSGFYHQGASLHSKFPVTYLMQWTAILEAKKRGCKLYNFWGISPTDSIKHPWYGLTQFKKGFGGFQTDYLPTQDLALSGKYYLPYIFEKLVRLKRRL